MQNIAPSMVNCTCICVAKRFQIVDGCSKASRGLVLAHSQLRRTRRPRHCFIAKLSVSLCQLLSSRGCSAAVAEPVAYILYLWLQLSARSGNDVDFQLVDRRSGRLHFSKTHLPSACPCSIAQNSAAQI